MAGACDGAGVDSKGGAETLQQMRQAHLASCRIWSFGFHSN